jgi:hypothetical protein
MTLDQAAQSNLQLRQARVGVVHTSDRGSADECNSPLPASDENSGVRIATSLAQRRHERVVRIIGRNPPEREARAAAEGSEDESRSPPERRRAGRPDLLSG